MTEPESAFYRRCRICGRELMTPWGPNTHTEARQQLTEHINGHTEQELRDWALRVLVGGHHEG